MPGAIKTICAYPGCNTLVLKGRCSKHTKREDPRPPAHRRGYDSSWTRLRRAFVRSNPVCQIRHYCDGDPVEEVDHIVPLAQGGARLDPANLQSACKRCHAYKTAQDRVRYSATGEG